MFLPFSIIESIEYLCRKKSLTRNQNTQLLLSNHSRVRPVEFWRSTLLTQKKTRRAIRAPLVTTEQNVYASGPATGLTPNQNTFDAH